jgi:hypothetical protein
MLFFSSTVERFVSSTSHGIKPNKCLIRGETYAHPTLPGILCAKRKELLFVQHTSIYLNLQAEIIVIIMKL